MRLLIVAPRCGPNQGGAPLRVFNWIRMLKGKTETWLLATEQEEDPGIADRFFHQRFPDTFFSKIRKCWNYYKTDFSQPLLPEKPDIVQIHTPYLWALGRHFPGTPKILVAHDVNWNLLKYDLIHGPGFRKIPGGRFLLPWFLWRATAFEKKALWSAVHVFVCSDKDKSAILGRLPGLESKITVLPNAIDCSRYAGTTEQGRCVLFMGPMSYSANVEAAQIICEELAVRLPRLPFKILGGKASREETPANVEFLGFVPDILPVLREAKIFIVPLRKGSGTRWKILEAFAAMRCVVSTGKGAEGLKVTHGVNIWIEEDWEGFARAIERLWNDDEKRKKLAQCGRELVEKEYDYRKYAEAVQQIYRNVS